MNKLQFEDLKCILKEGWIEKESRFFKKWHKRWIVLTQQSLYTFKKEKQYFNPTEIINLGQISAIRQETDVQEEFRFVKVIHSQKSIQTIDCVFNMRIENEQEQQRWINLISSQMIKLKQ